MSVELVTGFAGYDESGEPKRHVSSSDDGMRQYGTVGPGMYVLETASMLSAELESANSLVMQPGDLMINGRHVRCPDATVFSIPVGTQGMMTSNLCVIRYKREAGDVESAEALVLTGEPSASDPQDPAVSEGDVADGAEQVDFPLYRVVTTGIESEDPVALFRTIPPLVDVADDLEAFKAPGAIKTANLADDAVTAAKIATNAVTADGIAAGAVGSSELASNAVQTAKIAANAVTSDKLAQAVRNSISHPTLWSGTVTTGGSVTVSGIASWLMVGLVVSLSASSTVQTTVIPCTVLNGYLSGASGIALEDPNTGARILAVTGRVSGTKMTINVASMTNCSASDNAVTLPTNSMKIYKVIGLVHV